MKTILAALATVVTLTCSAANPPVDQTEASPIFIYATYFKCNNATVGNADDAVTRLYKPALNTMIAAHTVTSWGWLGRSTGGEWARAGYFTGASINAVMAANAALRIVIDHPKAKYDFDETCSSSEDYLWHMLAGNDARGHRGEAAFSTYYVCDQSREAQADALMKHVLSAMYDRLVADGKLTSWGWAEHIVGGKYRRLETMTAPTTDALMAAREAIVAAAEHDPLNEAFTSICGSHQDYVWDVKDQGP
jgi:hypothetical protein